MTLKNFEPWVVLEFRKFSRIFRFLDFNLNGPFFKYNIFSWTWPWELFADSINQGHSVGKVQVNISTEVA